MDTISTKIRTSKLEIRTNTVENESTRKGRTTHIGRIVQENLTGMERRYAQQDMDAFPFSKGLAIMVGNVITSFRNLL